MHQERLQINWNKLDLDKLFAVVFTFINVHKQVFAGATGDIEIKNSNVRIDKNNNKLIANVF